MGENVFVHDDALRSRDIYIKTPSHCFGNHQSNVALLGEDAVAAVAVQTGSRRATGTPTSVPAVARDLGQDGGGGEHHRRPRAWQINACESWPEGYVCFNRRFMYAGLDWCTQNYSQFIDQLRELCGGGVFQDAGRHLGDGTIGGWPSSSRLLADAAGRTPVTPHEAMFKLAWDIGRLGIRRPPPAIREVLRRPPPSSSATTLSRDRLERVQPVGREPDGELRLSDDGGGGTSRRGRGLSVAGGPFFRCRSGGRLTKSETAHDAASSGTGWARAGPRQGASTNTVMRIA